MNEQTKLPPQTPKERTDAKPDFRAIRLSRRCYEIQDAEYGSLNIFWLNGDGSRDLIPRWPGFPSTLEAQIPYLRSRGYITTEEAAKRE